MNAESRAMLENLFSLGFIQGTNFLLSVLTFPYIIRTIGVENFGLVTLLQALMFYFVVLTDYGFNLSATKDISVNRNNKSQLAKTYSEVLTIKAILFIVCLGILVSAVYIIPGYKKFSDIAFFSFTIVLGQVLLPTWFFQGVEKMKYITYITIFTRALYAICIFTFINTSSDFIYINLINGLSATIGGLISLWIVYKKFNITFCLPTKKQLWSQFLNSWNIFISNVTVTVANNTNILILGLFTTPLVLGYYSIAEKVFTICRSLAGILHQVVYPRVCMLAQDSFEILSIFLKKIFFIILFTFLPLSLGIFFFSEQIVYLISGEKLEEAALILRIIALGPLMAALNIPVTQTLLAYHLSKRYALVISAGAFVNVMLNFILAYFFEAVGTAFCILITEILITIMLYFSIFKHYPHYFFLSKYVNKIHLRAN